MLLLAERNKNENEASVRHPAVPRLGDKVKERHSPDQRIGIFWGAFLYIIACLSRSLSWNPPTNGSKSLLSAQQNN
jgi:hypothetical protein